MNANAGNLSQCTSQCIDKLHPLLSYHQSNLVPSFFTHYLLSSSSFLHMFPLLILSLYPHTSFPPHPPFSTHTSSPPPPSPHTPPFLLRDGRSLTDDEIIGMLIGLLMAGQHTSTTTSAWLGFFLAKNKSLQVAS